MPPRPEPSVTAGVESVLGPAPSSHKRPEVVVVRFRRHGWRLIAPVVVLAAVACAAGLWVGTLPKPWMNLLAGIGAIVLALGGGVLPIVLWLTRRTKVTSRRVQVQHGLLNRHRETASFYDMREVRMKRGLFQRMRGAGDVHLMLRGSKTMVLKDVPDVLQITEALQELMEWNFHHESQTRAQEPVGRPAQAGQAQASTSFFAS